MKQFFLFLLKFFILFWIYEFFCLHFIRCARLDRGLGMIKLQDWSISSKLWGMAWLAITSLIITGAIGIYNMDRGRRSTFKALKYNNAITNAVDISRAAQAEFKLQVQEWKNVLLRGHDPKLYKKYWKGFEKQEVIVRAHLKKLIPIFKEFNLKEKMVVDAIDANIELGKQYRSALKLYHKGIIQSTFQVDKAVRGIDRKPTDDIDNIVDYIHEFQISEMKKIQEETKLIHDISLVISSVIGVLAVLLLFISAKIIIDSINKPILHTIKIFNKIGREKLKNKIITSRRDEIGDLWRALNDMQMKIREKNMNLVKANKEINESLNEVKRLKEEQDGDYFLTSLLTQPLNGNRSKSNSVEIECLLEQKKKFKFRKWEKEIGGDLIVVDDIELQGKKYIVFLNADAMGKSIQGAGGSLVVGSVFRSLLERTTLSQSAQKISPERWLKNSFIEIHKVFETFNGSMLISAVVGLIDEDSGLLYYLNAEHPNMVIYRDNSAQFIDKGIMLRKMGHMGAEGRISIGTFKLFPGDVILMGSDGKDDLQLGEDEGKRIINEDETLFLSIVSDNKGDINKIVEEMKRHGSITDDLSILKIKYVNTKYSFPELKKDSINILKQLYKKENQQTLKERLDHIEEALLKEFPEHPTLLRDLTWGYMKVKQYEKSLEYAKKYIDIQPEHSDYLYIASYAAKKTGNYIEAADYGERLRLRDRNLFRNLLNLTDIYLLMNERRRALQISNEMLEIDPDHKMAQKVNQSLSKAG